MRIARYIAAAMLAACMAWGESYSCLTFDSGKTVVMDTPTDLVSFAGWVNEGGTWTHYADCNGTQYVNGVAGAWTNSYWTYNTNSITIGDFAGSVESPLMPYSYALSAEQVAGLYRQDARRLNYTVATNQLASLPSPEWPLANIGGTNMLTEIPLRPNPLLPAGAAIPDVWDSSGSGNHGALMPTRAWGPTWIASVTDTNGVSRSGVYEYVDIDSNTHIQSAANTGISGSSARTIMAWAKSRATAQDVNAMIAAIGAGSTSAAMWFGADGSGSSWMFSFWGGGYDYDSNVAIDTRWHHFAMTYDGASYAGYIDGVKKVSGSASINTTASPLYLGKHLSVSSRNWDGWTDSAQVFDSALTSNQIFSAWQNTQPTNTPVSRYTFDRKPYEWQTYDGQHTITAYPEGTAGPTIGE